MAAVKRRGMTSTVPSGFLEMDKLSRSNKMEKGILTSKRFLGEGNKNFKSSVMKHFGGRWYNFERRTEDCELESRS